MTKRSTRGNSLAGAAGSAAGFSAVLAKKPARHLGWQITAPATLDKWAAAQRTAACNNALPALRCAFPHVPSPLAREWSLTKAASRVREGRGQRGQRALDSREWGSPLTRVSRSGRGREMVENRLQTLQINGRRPRMSRSNRMDVYRVEIGPDPGCRDMFNDSLRAAS
ncbi:hypothetical protein JX265_001576 [Neoarthrinium moseri]|uniref:Uncharacterized protein n=1 Tax=Neoarthrinium moseri TaxID=1658444 RepID=A0A9P9WVE3_9PEZI|nr:uncharacterized protein JN550_003971 [Neoarthrinium moseri]KAI1872252.1 hypothetical protein JN550_003971 [Neoarthrinium moseri]KAI1879955.1 hypothetical protein JX265_001576 [Neoarthrinium moseri]